jgi:serine kinase of HPr protein (carbohydrate metabolism regulator)
MKVIDLAKQLDLKVITDESAADREISGVYICDLLSWVMSRANKDNVWITVLTNLNIVAVAVMAELGCIIIPEGIVVEEITTKRAVQEGVNILTSDMNSYELSCKLQKILR